MSFFGLTDPWIVGSYVGCIVTVVLCCIVGIKVRKSDRGDDG